jgi:hypothetical protein
MPRTHPSDPVDALGRWLAAERSGFADDAEGALAELLEELPRPAPPAGFADRVLARTGHPEAAIAAAPASPARLPAWLRPRRRRLGGWRLTASLGAAAAFAAALLALFWLPAAVRAVLGAASVSALLEAGIGAIVALGQGLAGMVVLGNKIVLLGRAVAEPLATPPVAALAVAGLLVSIVALRCLYDLIQRDRRWVDADPI